MPVITQEIPKDSIVRGDSNVLSFEFQTQNDQSDLIPFPLNGFSDIIMQYRDKPNVDDGILYADLSLENGLTISGEDDNILLAQLTIEQSNAFLPNKTPLPVRGMMRGVSVNAVMDGRYYYDIRFLINDSLKTFLKGTSEIIANITQTPL